MERPKIRGLARRELLVGGLALTVAGSLHLRQMAAAWGMAGQEGEARGPDSEHGRRHLPRVAAPRTAPTGSVVPVVVSLGHPMETGHHIEAIEILNYDDPVVSKGRFHLTPANGEAYLSTQVRMSEGDSSLAVLANCSQHGEWRASQPITVLSEGCATAGGEREITEIGQPILRFPEPIARDKVVKVQVKFRHPSRTGLEKRGAGFLQVKPPFYLKTMEVYYAEERVSLYEMTSALSDTPFITFKLRTTEEAPLRVVFTNSEGHRYAVEEALKFCC
jgi:desulfoferrodoxin (superoxide reductase-like protein)